MAHFALTNENNEVVGVYVVANERLLDETGAENEALGVAFCEQIIGPGRYIQTSYNASMRGKYAGIGDFYDDAADVFYSPEVEAELDAEAV